MFSKFPRFFAYAGLIFTILFWSGNAVVARSAIQDISPIALSMGRWLIAFIILMPFGFRSIFEQRELYIKSWKKIIWLALLSVALYNTLLYLAAHTTSAVNITLVASSMPVMVILLVWFLLNKKPSSSKIIGMITVFLGLAIVIGGFSSAGWKNLEFRFGDLLMLLATLGWSLYSVQYKQWEMNKYNAIGLLTVLVGVGCIMIAPVYLYQATQGNSITFDKSTLLTFLYIGIFPSVLAYLFWNKGMDVLGPTIASLIYNLIPLFTAVLAFLILKESLALQHYLGGGLMLLGLFISSKQE